MTDACKNCRYFKAWEEEDEVGECRISPPQFQALEPFYDAARTVLNMAVPPTNVPSVSALLFAILKETGPSDFGRWPVIPDSEWCGSWAPKNGGGKVS